MMEETYFDPEAYFPLFRCRTQDVVPVPSVRDALGQHHTARVLRRAGYSPLPPYHPEYGRWQTEKREMPYHEIDHLRSKGITLHTSVPSNPEAGHYFYRDGPIPNDEIIGVEEILIRPPRPEPWSEQQRSSLRRVLDFEELRRPR